MGSISTNFGSNNAYTVELIWQQTSQNVSANTSAVNLKCYLRSNRSTATFTGQARTDKVVVGSQQFAPSHGAYTVPGSGNVLLWEINITVSHDSDGSFSKAISFTVGIGTTFSSTGYIESVSASGTISLTTIPRASTASVTSSMTLGTKYSIKITAASSAFKHNAYLICGSASAQIVSSKAGGTYYFTPAIATFAPQITTSTSKSASVRVDTYNGSSLIGQKTYSVKLLVPASVAPTISSFSVNIVNENTVVSGWGVSVAGYTKAKWSVTAAGSYGSTISSYSVKVGSKSSTSKTGSLVLDAGTITPSSTVKDSRGRSASKNSTAITVYSYSKPTISGVSAYRCDESGAKDDFGGNIKIAASIGYSSVNGHNSCVLKYRSKYIDGSFGDWTQITSGEILSGFSIDRTFVLEVCSEDLLQKSNTIQLTVLSSAISFHLREGGKGAAFGKYSESDELLDVAWDERIRGSLDVLGNITSEGSFIYGGTTHHTFSPVQQGGGTNQLTNKVYMGWGNSDEPGLLVTIDRTDLGPLVFKNDVSSTTVNFQNASVTGSDGSIRSIPLKLYKFGRMVFLYSARTVVFFAKSNTAYLDSGLIPTAYRPIADVHTVGWAGSGTAIWGRTYLWVTTSGNVYIASDYTAGSAQEIPFSCCWISST